MERIWIFDGDALHRFFFTGWQMTWGGSGSVLG